MAEVQRLKPATKDTAAEQKPSHRNLSTDLIIGRFALNRINTGTGGKADFVYFNAVLGLPNPSRLKLTLKLVLSGLTLCVTPKVTVQHSQNDMNLLIARKPMKRLSRTS